ncbi:hypothetical protein IIB97_00870 [Patescibacteria group bacterium]|nr:hypothetical protein [Patescibacteria group bacterium]
MDLEELKRILQKDKGKIIIVENGKPVMIILLYENQGSKDPSEDTQGPFEKEREAGVESEELNIDDLPI